MTNKEIRLMEYIMFYIRGTIWKNSPINNCDMKLLGRLNRRMNDRQMEDVIGTLGDFTRYQEIKKRDREELDFRMDMEGNGSYSEWLDDRLEVIKEYLDDDELEY